jgi:hypothetical protein
MATLAPNIDIRLSIVLESRVPIYFPFSRELSEYFPRFQKIGYGGKANPLTQTRIESSPRNKDDETTTTPTNTTQMKRPSTPSQSQADSMDPSH